MTGSEAQVVTAEVVPCQPNFMARHGARLVDLGYRVIPIMPGTKAPGLYHSKSWGGYRDWTRHCGRSTKAFELSIWKDFPAGCGVGIACGNVVALDIDVLDRAVALRIEAAAREVLGDTPAVRVGLPPKRLLVYRAKGKIHPIKRHPLEIIAHGNQFVAYAIHPVTQKPYEWINEPLDEIMLERLPLVTQEQCEQFLAGAESMLPAELRQRRLGRERSWEHFGGGDLLGTAEGVASAIEWISNDDLAYDDWVYIGMALKGALPDDGLVIWREWSARSQKNDPGVTDKAWWSFRPKGIGAGTIYRFALDAGWSPPPGVELNGTRAALCEGVDVSAFATSVVEMSDVDQALLAPSDESMPVTALPDEPTPAAAPPPCDFVATAPGLLGDITRWIVDSASSPQPLLALGATLAFVGSLIGQRWKLDAPDTRSNVYIAALAGSGSGKEYPRNAIKRLAVAAGLEGYLSEEIGSSAGLMTQVWRHNCRVYLIDELGHFIGGVTSKRAAQHKADILPALTKMWSSSNSFMLGRELAELRSEDAVRMDINQPCVCVYGSTVPSTFWGALAGMNVEDGSLARWLVFPIETNYPDETPLVDAEPGMPPLTERCLSLITGMDRPDALQIASAIGCVQQPPGARTQAGSFKPAVKPNPKPRIVPLTPAAAALMRELSSAGLALKRQHDGAPTASVAARWYEHIRRVSLIAAVAAAPTAPLMDVGHLDWAREVVDLSTFGMLAGISEFVADTDHEADVKRVLRSVGRDWVAAGVVCRKTQWIRRGDRNDILAQLVESGRLEVKKVLQSTEAGGRPSVFYRRHV